MPRKSPMTEEPEKELMEPVPIKETNKDEVENLNRLLAAVLNYLSDDEVEVIDIEFLLENTEGLQEWWDQYREKNRKQIEEEIKKSLGDLSMEDLEGIREKIKQKAK